MCNYFALWVKGRRRVNWSCRQFSLKVFSREAEQCTTRDDRGKTEKAAMDSTCHKQTKRAFECKGRSYMMLFTTDFRANLVDREI